VALYAADGSHPDRAVLQVFARDGAYAPLGIEPGFNCLYPAGEGEAWMVPVGTDETACLKPRSALASKGTRLEVQIAPGGGNGGGDAPEAVRWDWDASRMEHYVGFNCDGRWCEAGRSGFVSSEVPGAVLATLFEEVPGTPAATEAEMRRVTQVKGWFDQQRLAEPDGRGGLVPGTVTGTVFPHPALDRLDDRRTFDAGWVPVSYVYLDGESPTYKRKLNLDAGVNRMYLRFGDPAAFIPPGGIPGTCVGDVGWWMKVVSAKGDVAYRCASYEAHPGVNVPGTARWRWLDDDETTWQRCPSGCCPIS
jgi:hypothetical protein